MLLVLIFNLTFAWAIDFTKYENDYAVSGKNLVPVYSSKDSLAEKIGFLPSNSYIKALYKDDPRDWKAIRFAYVAARPECKVTHTNKEVSDRMNQIFKVSLDMKLDNDGMQTNLRTVLRDYKVPEYCFKMSQGFVRAEQLTVPKKLTTEATGTLNQTCVDCKKESELSQTANHLLSLLQDSKNDTQLNKTVESTPPPSQICGTINKPEVIKLPGITLKAQWIQRTVEEYVNAVNSKGQTYKKAVLKKKWFCDISFPEGCHDEEDATLPKVVKIANYYVSKNKNICEQALTSFYSECSVWKDKSIQQRYKEVEAVTRKTVAGLKKQKGKEFANAITPELLQCMVYRENHQLEPVKVNYRACEPRINPEKKYRKYVLQLLGESEMRSWKSAANGLNQHRLETFKENWDKFLKSEKPLFYNEKNKTYEQIYENADDLFELMGDYPELQIEKMARDLNFRYNKFNFQKCLAENKGFTKFDCTILSYDGDQKETYLPKVKQCTECLDNNPKSFDCLKMVHPEKLKTKREKNRT